MRRVGQIFPKETLKGTDEISVVQIVSTYPTQVCLEKNPLNVGCLVEQYNEEIPASGTTHTFYGSPITFLFRLFYHREGAVIFPII